MEKARDQSGYAAVSKINQSKIAKSRSPSRAALVALSGEVRPRAWSRGRSRSLRSSQSRVNPHMNGLYCHGCEAVGDGVAKEK